MKGRPPKPTALKALEGNAGHRAADGVEPAPDSTYPPAPDWLHQVGPLAVQKYYSVADIMSKVGGWLTEADQDAIAFYAVAWARKIEAEIRIPALRRKEAATRDSARRGRITNEINSLIGQQKQAIKECTALGDRIGLNCTARTRIRVNPGQAELPLDDNSPFTAAARLAGG